MKTIVISLGGSTIVPDGPDVNFLKKFRTLIIKFIDQGYKFVIVAGGGKTCREYQATASGITDISKDNLDWLGIQATFLNAFLIRTIFHEYTHAKIIRDPTKNIEFNEKILVASGWKPGRSTDNSAIMLAVKFGIKTIINLTDINYVYDKDPKFKDAKPLTKVSWENFLKIIGDKWDPGLNLPFDPVASKLAMENNKKVIVLKGIDNLEKFLENRAFTGTVITSISS